MAKEVFRSQLDGIVLAAIASGPLHGYAIIEEIKRRSSGHFDPPEGTVYPILHRLEADGLLSSAWNDPATGRRRRVYALTKSGDDALAHHKNGWAQFSDAMGAFLGDVPCPV